MKITEMKKAHIEELARLEALCFSAPWTENALLEEIDNQAAYFVTALNEERVLGYAGMHCASPEYFMDNIAVFKQYRKNGVGSALILALSEEVERRCGKSLSLEVRPSNSGAVALYSKLGFAEEGRRKNFYTDPTEDALILTRRFG